VEECSIHPVAKAGWPEPQRELVVSAFQRPGERASYVVHLVGKGPEVVVETPMRRHAAQALRDLAVPFRVAQPRCRRLATLLQSLPRVLPDRLKHPVTLIGKAEKALLDEGLQGVK